MVVDLPTPGEPVMPTRIALPVSGSSSCTSRCACLLMVGALALDQRDRARERRAVAGAELERRGKGCQAVRHGHRGSLAAIHPARLKRPIHQGEPVG